MRAILKKSGTKAKPISGKVLQNGLNRITLAIIKPDGSTKLQGFTKDKYIITYYD